MKIIYWIKNNYALTIILITATFLRFLNLDFQSLWVDEIYTMIESNPDFTLTELYNSILTSDPHPPLYFILSYLFFKIFGYTAFVAKMLSAILSIGGIYAIYLLGKELYNKNTGIFAAALVSINFFSIYYAQEARMYSLMFLTTTLSFYYLIKFIKQPTNRFAILFCLTSVLMIYSHLFTLFTLLAQYMIILLFTIQPFHVNKKKMFMYLVCIIAITIILYIPVIGIILNNLDRESIWIQMPTADVYTQFFKDFFGQSELVIFFITTLMICFFVKLFSAKDTYRYSINPNTDKIVFSFIILFMWILVTLILPLIRTYTSLPMLINRYFINILPAIIIIISIGLVVIKNKIVRASILSIIIIFSLTDIFVVKKFYFTPYKSQFREVSKFITDNNSSNETVATSLAPYYNFYLNNENTKTIIIDKPLQVLVNEMMSDSTKRKSFWYADAHSKILSIDDKASDFLEKNFFIGNSIDAHDAWARHYILGKPDIVNENLSKFNILKKNSGKKINFWIENFQVEQDTLKFSGWGFIEGQDAIKSKTKAVFIAKNGKAYGIQTESINRPDITKSNDGKFNLNNSGFDLKMLTKKVPLGSYTLGILITNSETGSEGLIITDKIFQNK